MGCIVIRRSLSEDVGAIVEDMRESDKYEVSLAGQTPTEALTEGLRHPLCYTGLYKGKPIFMFGSGPYQDSIGIVWLLGTNAIDKNKKAFQQITPKMWELVEGNFTHLINFVPSSNKRTLRWLEKAGASLSQPIQIENEEVIMLTYECNKTDRNPRRITHV